MTRCVRQSRYLLLAVIFCLFSGGTLFAQSANRLVIVGPELEHCLVTVRYYKTRQIAKVISLKLSLLNGGIEESVEPGFDGVEVFLQARAVPIQISLLADAEVLSTKELEKPGATIKISAGKIGRVEHTPAEIELSQADSRLLEAYVASYNAQKSTRSLVADIDQALIDYQCLDVFNRELHLRIGAVDLEQSIKSFMAWEGDSASRMIAGVLRGESGVCGIRLVVSAGKLVDLQPNCHVLVDDYFREPLDTEQYIKNAEQLVRHLFSGAPQKAHQLYGQQYRQHVSVDQLSKLCETLHERFGKEVDSITLKRAALLDYNFSQKSQLLQVDLLLDIDGKARCMGRVTFSVPVDRNRVGKCTIAGVHFNQVFQSSHPELATTTQRLIEQIGRSLSFDQYVQILHPDMKPIVDQQAIQAMFDRLGILFKDQQPSIDYDLWAMTQFNEFVHVAGSLKYGESDCYIELQFADGHLLGFSFYGPALAESTLGLLNFPASLVDIAKEFWTHLLNDNADAAHSLLNEGFQKQFTLEQMKQQLAQPEEQPSKLKEVQVDSVRLSNQTSRSATVMATVFLTARFDDSRELQVACDVALPPAESKPSIYNFSNELDIDFPVASIPLADVPDDGAKLAIDAFRSMDPSKILQLIQPTRRADIDQATLKAYFENLKKIAGTLAEPVSIARTVEYQAQGKRYRCNLSFKDVDNEALPIEVWFYRGYLDRFVASHPKINDFTETLEDKSGIKRRVESFVEAWFQDPDQSLPFMISALHTQGTLGALNTMKNEFEQKNAKLVKYTVDKESAGEGSGELEFVITLQGELGSRNARVLVDIGAFGGLVSAITFQ